MADVPDTITTRTPQPTPDEYRTPGALPGNLVIDMGGRRKPDFARDLPAQGTEGAAPRAFGADPDQGGRTGDAGDAYMIRRQAQEAAELQRFMRELSAGGASPSASPSVGAPTAGPSSPQVDAAPPASAAPAGVAAPAGAVTGWKPGEPTLFDDIKNVARAVPGLASSLGGELVRLPRAAVSGVMEALQETSKAGGELGRWMSEVSGGVLGPVSLDEYRTLLRAEGKAAEADQPDDVLWQRIERSGEELLKDVLPVPETPNSKSGPIVKAVSQFLTGMWLGGKAMKGVGVTLKGAKGGLAAGAVGDFIAFDPKEENVAALLKKVPALNGPVTQFLATDPKDNDALNRLRRSVEGMGLGVATDALIRGLQVYRASRAARKTVEQVESDALATQRAKYGELTEADMQAKLGSGTADQKIVVFDAKGGPDAKALAEAADDPAKQAALKNEPKPAAGDLPGGRIAVNWAAVSTGDDVKVALREMADHYKASISAAKRGKMKQAETQQLADELGLTVDELLQRQPGQALNAEQALAARQLLTAATEKLLETARIAQGPNASAVDLFAFRRMLATQAAVQNEVMAARAEAGRALASWKIPASAKGDIERSRSLIEALEAGGGEDMARDLARRIAILADTGADAVGVNAVVRKGWGATTWDAVSEVWVNALLSNPKTHFVNIASNTLALGQQIIERGLAEKFSALLRAEGAGVTGVAPGEASAMIAGLVAAQKDAWKMAWLALRSGETGRALGKIDLGHSAAVSAENFRINGGPLATAVDFLGTVERVPGRLLGSEDEFFKTIGYRMELYAQAQRQATGEGLMGRELRERVADLIAKPPEHIRLAAADAALYTTFTTEASKAAKAIIQLREEWPVLLPIIPFVKTPVNIVRYSFERTPLAPLMSHVRADLAAGGARAEIATARIALGTSIMLMAADYADRGLITGKGPMEPGKREALMRQGWQPYSIRSGDKWISYDRADPYGMLLGFAADMAEFNRRFDIDPDHMDEMAEIWAAGISAVSQTTINKSYLQGISDFAWMIEDPKRRAFDYLGRQVGSVVPAGVNMIRQMGDPIAREHMAIWDYVQSRLPELSKSLTPRRDLWGKEMQADEENGAAFNALSPGQVRRVKPSPVDAEMTRLGLNVERIDKRAPVGIGKATAIMNFRDWPEAYDRYVVLAGNAMKDPASGLGAKDFLDQTVQGKGSLGELYSSLSDGPEGGKAELIRGVVAKYRKLAQAELLAHPKLTAFQEAWREAVDKQNAARAPLAGVAPPPTPRVPIPSLNSPMQAPR